MTEAKHTPGPWFSPDRRGTRYVEARIGGGMLQEVAACGPTERPEHQAANARLIAAAPELFRELEDLIGLAASAMHAANRDGSEYDIDAELKSARAAIAKALGEQA